MLIVRRFDGIDTAFSSGNWVFTTASVTVAGTPVTQNINGLSTGDVNSSDNLTGIPKSVQTVNLINDGTTTNSSKDSFALPIKVGNAMQLGAISLKLTYPTELATFEGISGSNFIANDNKGIITLAWADMTGGKEPLNLKAEDALVALKFKPSVSFKAGTQFSVALDADYCEFANVDGDVINNANIKIASVEASIPAAFSLKQNYPNPFNPSTKIEYDLPENANVKLVIYNMLGEQVATLVNKVQAAGIYNFVWNAGKTSSGIYFYRLTADAGNQKFTKIYKMMLLK